MEEYVAPSYVEHNPAVPHDIEGIEGAKANFEQFHEAFSDLNVTFEDLIADGDKVVQRHRVTGTHDGELMDLNPSGKAVDSSGQRLNQEIDSFSSF